MFDWGAARIISYPLDSPVLCNSVERLKHIPLQKILGCCEQYSAAGGGASIGGGLFYGRQGTGHGTDGLRTESGAPADGLHSWG